VSRASGARPFAASVRKRLYVALCALAVLAIAGTHVALLARFGVDFPRADDFSQVLPVPYYLAVQETLSAKLAYLASLSVEHRMLTERLTVLAQTALQHRLDFVALLYVGAALLAVVGALVVAATPPSCRAAMAVLAAALLASPYNEEAHFWASGALAHFGVLAYALAAIWCASRAGLAWSVAAAVLALAAALTAANGLMAFPAIAAMTWRLHRRRAAAAWLAMAALVIAAYFTGYERAAGQPSLPATLLHPVSLVRFLLAALGSHAVHMGPVLALGVLLATTWVALLVAYRRTLPPVVLGWGTFLLLSYAAMSAGRASLGDEGALLSRYRVYSETMLLVTVAAVLSQAGRRARVAVLAVVVPLALAWTVAGWVTELPTIARMSLVQRTSRDHHALTGRVIPEGWPPTEFAEFMLARAHDRGYYDSARHADPPLVPEPDARALPADTGTGLWIERMAGDPKGITLHGFVPHEATGVTLWLSATDRQYRVPLHVSRTSAPAGRPWVMFWGTITLDRVQPGDYRLGVAYARSGAGELHWLRQDVEVR